MKFLLRLLAVVSGFSQESRRTLGLQCFTAFSGSVVRDISILTHSFYWVAPFEAPPLERVYTSDSGT